MRARSPVLDHDSDHEIYHNGVGDSRGYFSEGTYIAAPPIGPVIPDDISDDDDFTRVVCMPPIEAYTTRILSLFHEQRNSLRSIPSMKIESPHKLDLKKCVDGHDPVPGELVAMSTVDAFSVLKLVTKRLKKYQNITSRMSAWIMSILARLDEKLMNADDMYLVRKLGQKATWIRVCFDEHMKHLCNGFEGTSESESEETDEDRGGYEEGPVRGRQQGNNIKSRRRNTSSLSQYRAPEPELEPQPETEPKIEDSPLKTAAEARLGSYPAVEAARLRLLEKLDHDCEDDPSVKIGKVGTLDLPDVNTIATLDMIITIAGEVYGQRDLLEGRLDWEYLDGT